MVEEVAAVSIILSVFTLIKAVEPVLGKRAIEDIANGKIKLWSWFGKRAAIITAIILFFVTLSALVVLFPVFAAVVYAVVNGPSIPILNIAIAGACSLFGVAAYTIRCRARLTYGLIETAIGVVAAYEAARQLDATIFIQLAAGIYIIVRGLDNMEKGLKHRTDLHEAWIKVFGSQT